MLDIFIVNQRLSLGENKTMFEIDDVLQLQCTGEVETINAMSSQVLVLTIAFIHVYSDNKSKLLKTSINIDKHDLKSNNLD